MNGQTAMAGALGLAANQGQFTFRIAEQTGAELTVAAFTGEQVALSEDYRYQVRLRSAGPLEPSPLVGRPAVLEIATGRQPVLVHGLIAEFGDAGPVPGGREYLATLVSPLFPLALARNNRVFINKTVPRIIEEVLVEAGFAAADFEFRLHGDYPVREYTVQYDESDYDFIARLLSRSGLFFSFEAGRDQARVLFHDGVDELPAAPGGEALPFRPQSGTHRGRETIFAFGSKARLLPGRVELKDFNYRTPEVGLEVGDSRRSAPGHGSDYRCGENYQSLQEGQDTARNRQQAYDWQRATWQAESDFRGATPGTILTLTEHPDPQANGDYLIIAVEPRGEQANGFAYGRQGGAPTYRNRMTLVRAGTPFRKPLPAQRRVHGVFTARIESIGGEYAYLDEQGRYRVRADFDRGDAAPGQASHPVRLMQPYSGDNYGLHCPLHPGTEVALACVNGDLDRPVLLGALPNPETPGPVSSANPSQHILRTWGGNELLMDDRNGKERIELFTEGQKNLLRLDADSAGHKVRLATAEGAMEVSAAKTLLMESGDTHRVDSGAEHLIFVENGQQLTTRKGEIELQAATDLRIKAADHQYLQAEREDISMRAGKDMVVQVGEAMAVEVRNQNLTLLVKDGQLSIEAAKDINILGQGGGTIHIGQSGGQIEIDPQGNITIDSHTVDINGQSVNIQGSSNSQGGGGGFGGTGVAAGQVVDAQVADGLGSADSGPGPGRGFGLSSTTEAASRVAQKKTIGSQAGSLAAGSTGVAFGAAATLTRARELEAKKNRLAERQSLIQQGLEMAQKLSGKDKEKLQAAAQRLELNNRAVERARLADDVYNAPGEKDPPIGWKRSSNNPKDLPAALKDAAWEHPASGFRAAFYDSEIDGSKVLAFRGTADKAGWKNNLQQGLGFESEQYKRAIKLASDIEDTYPNGFEIAGHSLGGGLTSAASIVTKAKGFSFNAAGLHPNTIKEYGLARSAGEKLIDAYQVKGEVLTSAQNPVVNAAITPLGTGVRYLRQANPVSLYKVVKGETALNFQPVWVYDAVGTTHALPAVDENGKPRSLFSAGPVDRHSMDNVINGIEKQKMDDKNAIAKALKST